MSLIATEVAIETFPTDGAFTIARGARTEAVVVVATVSDGVHRGRGECVPYARYGETVDGVVAAIRAVAGLGRSEALSRLPAGAARNALDCAWWDLEAKRTGRRVWELAGMPPPEPVVTCFTLSLDTPEAMAARALSAADKPLLKLKLGAPGDERRLRAVRAARPDARLVADANEGWPADMTASLLAVCVEVGVEVVEQPLPAGADAMLGRIAHPVPVCADESVHGSADVARLMGLYDAVNVKLDKAGGLTGALALTRAAREAGMRIMVGCMVSTSLAMAPAVVVAGGADWVDLDGPLLLARDRTPGITYRNGCVEAPPRELWG